MMGAFFLPNIRLPYISKTKRPTFFFFKVDGLDLCAEPIKNQIKF